MIDLNFKANFFDRPAVQRAVDRAKLQGLREAGSFIRTRARSSMGGKVKRALPRRPGQPPRVREGSLKRLLFYVYDRSTESVVVGPVAFRRRKVPVPALHEFGGVVKTRRRRPQEIKRGTPPFGKEVRTAVMPRRPYMGPALEAEIQAGTLPRAFENSVRSG